MLDGLHEHKHAPEDQRHKADALQLQNGIGGTGSSLGEVGQNQRQRGQSPQNRERGGRALKLERLLEVLARPEDEAETDNAIENDHHRRKHRVPSDALTALGSGKHDRDNEPGFDHRHRNREKDRAKRLAKLERQHLGVMDGGEHRRAQKEAGKNEYVRIVGRNDMEQLQRHKSAGEQGHGPSPDRNGSAARRRHSIHSVGEVRLCKRMASRAIRGRRVRGANLTLSFPGLSSLLDERPARRARHAGVRSWKPKP